MPQTTPRRVIVALLLILTLAACLRTYGLRHLVYSNPDEALFSYFVTRVAGLSPFSLHPADNALANIMSWDYGWPLFILDDLYLRALTALNLPIYEATLALPTVTLGVLCCLLIYLLGSRFGRRVGLIAAALMAAMPMLVGLARSVGCCEAISGFLLLLAALQIVRYYEQPENRGRQWLAGISLGLYLCGDVQMMVGSAVLLLLTILWPRPAGYEGFSGWRRLTLRWGTLVPPVLLFLPYVPVYLYAVRLGYGDQTYLGTMLAEHKAVWGFHFAEFLHDAAENTGYLPLLLMPLVGAALRGRFGDSRLRWLVCWIALTAAPFLFAITGKVTEASGYHEHLMAGMALLLAAALAALRPRPVGTVLAGVAVAMAVFFTFSGVLRVDSLAQFRPDHKVPYGGLPPNNGMKTAGYWVRQNVPATEKVFVAHDSAVAAWYLGREAVIGGSGAGMERAPSFLKAKDQVSVAVIPDQQEYYPPALFAQNGFPGRVIVRSGGREVLSLYTRRPLQQTLETEQLDPQFTQAYHSPLTLVPPGSPYVPGKRVEP